MRIFKTHAIQLQIAAALLVLFSALAAIVFTSLTELDARKHDYIILNLTGQMRVISEVMLHQSENYVDNAARDYQAYDRDLKFYSHDLFEGIKNYDAIVTSLESRTLTFDLTGLDEAIICTWDPQSRGQMSHTADHWRIFKDGLLDALGPDQDEPRLEYAAQYIKKQGPALVNSSNQLAMAFQVMMEKKLARIKMLNQYGIAIALGIALLILLLLYRRAFHPLNNTIKGFQKVALGDLEYRLSVDSENEIGQLRGAFNQLTQRLSSVFKLTQRINQATDIDTTLRFVYEEFRPLLPLDWVGLLRQSVEGNALVLDRLYGAENEVLCEGNQFPIDSIGQDLCQDMQPRLYEFDQAADSPLLGALYSQQLKSILFLPLQSQANTTPILIFAAADEQAYSQQHIDLLSNISTQISISLDKTQGMENLVISAVEGLAKLAESRDPETGDHLLRMSLYSAIIADQLGQTGNYPQINHQYIRDLFRFAPMHDIGKVGIEDAILLKAGKLDEAERAEMQKHPVIGAEVLRRCEQQVRDSGHSIFQLGIEIAESHHERYDGKGYPHGLAGDDIPLSARIVATADVFDALTSKRPYKEAWSTDRALQHMQAESGKHFDPRVIEAMNQAIPKLMEIYERHKHV